mgnify:CR=1 FL=1
MLEATPPKTKKRTQKSNLMCEGSSEQVEFRVQDSLDSKWIDNASVASEVDFNNENVSATLNSD